MSADLLLGLPGQVKKLLDRLTTERAGYLDNLNDVDVAVSSRASSSDTGSLLSRLTSQRASNLDLIPEIPSNGPITGLYYSHGELDRFRSQIEGLPHIETQCTPTPVEVLNIAGPGMIGYLSFRSDSVSYFGGELEVDGVVVGTIPPSSYGFVVLGTLTPSDPPTFVPTWTTFDSSVILRAYVTVGTVTGFAQYAAVKL